MESGQDTRHADTTAAAVVVAAAAQPPTSPTPPPPQQQKVLVGAAPAGALTAADGKAFMDVILYGETAGWDSGKRRGKGCLTGHGKLMEDVLAARRSHENRRADAEDDGAATAATGRLTDGLSRPQQDDGAQTITVVAPGIVDDDVKEVLREAKRTFEAAEAALSNGLVNCEDWMGLRDDFYHAGAVFSLAGLPDDAARCLLQATYLNRAFQDDDEALVSLAGAIQHIQLAHPSVAVESLARLAKCYERSGLLFQAARCLREAGEVNDNRLDEKSAAIDFYTAAIDMYRRVQNPYKMERSLVEECHERLCYLHCILDHFDTAEKLFMEKAANTPRGLPTTRFYLYATLTVLARGSGSEEAYFDAIYDTKKTFDRLQEMDREYQKGKENALMRSLFAAFDQNSLNQFDLAVGKYREYATTVPNAAFDLVVARCRQNFHDHLERFA